jgi:hypothetical protein
MIQKFTSRALLILAFALSLLVVIYVLTFLGTDKTETWAIVAAVLAVLASVVSAWSSQKLMELQHESLQPFPLPRFDLNSRPGLMLLKIENHGTNPAYNVVVD